MPPQREPQPLPPTDAPASRWTWPGWLKRWGISAFSLGLGLATLFVFRRGLPHVGWIVGYLLLLVLLVAAITELRQPLERRGRRLVLTAADYAVQSLYHGLLLFVLPAYWASATLDSPNALFLACIVAAALVTAVDPWYAAIVHPRRWLNQALLAFSIFAALNVALPLLGIRPILALEGAAALTAVAMMPVFRERGAETWLRAYAMSAVLAMLAMAAVWLGRAAVPPAPLFVARATVAAVPVATGARDLTGGGGRAGLLARRVPGRRVAHDRSVRVAPGGCAVGVAGRLGSAVVVGGK